MTNPTNPTETETMTNPTIQTILAANDDCAKALKRIGTTELANALAVVHACDHDPNVRRFNIGSIVIATEQFVAAWMNAKPSELVGLLEMDGTELYVELDELKETTGFIGLNSVAEVLDRLSKAFGAW